MQSTKVSKDAGQTGSAVDEMLQLVSFKIGDEEFAVDILKVQEINRMIEVTRVPNAPEHIDGVINLRGKVIPIIDLRSRFGMARKEKDKNTRIVVVEVSGKIVGFVVDAVREVLRIPKEHNGTDAEDCHERSHRLYHRCGENGRSFADPPRFG